MKQQQSYITIASQSLTVEENMVLREKSRNKKMFSRYFLLILFLVGLFASGCAVKDGKHLRNGKEYGETSNSFQGHWWNYYERGRSFSDGKFYKEAIADFQKGIEDQDKDQWKAQTSDMNFTDYFPHREMGIIYFQRKQYNLAISELEDSILSAPSAKGHYFLNKARGAKIHQEGRDMSAPGLHFEGSSDKILTNTFTYIIKGVAEDDSYIASIQVGDIRIPIELAKKQQVFTTEIPLQEGENIIRIIATDLVKKTTEQNLEIYCDRSGPIVEILGIENEGDKEVIYGVVSDEGGIKSLQINGKPWNITGASSAYNFKFARPKDGIILIATDHAGNITKASLNEDDLEDDPLLNPRVAYLDPSTQHLPNSMVVSDAQLPLFPLVQAPPIDTDPPLIKLKDLLGTYQETYEDYVLFEVIIVDFSPIHSISINGEPISNKNGKKLYFSQLKKLTEGDNEFHIVAIDIHGNRSEKKININRRIQNFRQIGSRMSVAVLPFDHRGEASSIDELIQDQMIESFLEQKRFNVVERKKIEAGLRELKLISPDLMDPGKAVDLGKIVEANTILTGTVIESSDSIEIISQLIDTETATILASNDIFGEDKSFASLDYLLDRLAFKFKQDFPLLEGILIEVRNNEVVIDIGLEKQIKPNMHLLYYREGFKIKHPVTGRILGAEPEILGELTIKEVFEEFSKASIHRQKDDVRLYDRVIAK